MLLVLRLQMKFLRLRVTAEFPRWLSFMDKEVYHIVNNNLFSIRENVEYINGLLKHNFLSYPLKFNTFRVAGKYSLMHFPLIMLGE